MKSGEPAAGREKVALVVDDSSLLRRLVGRALVELGFHVIFAENGWEGCEIARQYRPDLVLMDVEMPVMNGIEAALCLRDDPATRRIPLIFLTALDEAEIAGRTRVTGCKAIMRKPLNKAQLGMLLKELAV